MKPEGILFKISWILLAIVGASILTFGLIASVSPGSASTLFFRAIGVASIGMGLFGLLITLIPYRHRERWAWLALWYYPIFWAAHFFGNLPPGQDHIHQIVFIILSLIGLLMSAREFLSRTSPEN